MRKRSAVKLRQDIVTRMEIDLDTLLQNYSIIKKYVAPAKVVAVVKSEAYGHGAVPIAHTLQTNAGCERFAVARVDEGIQLRRAGIKGDIMIMGAVLRKQFQAIIKHSLTPVLPDLERIEQWNMMARDLGTRLHYHLKVDVGLGRMGFMPYEGDSVARALLEFSDTSPAGISAHLSHPAGSVEHNEEEHQRFLDFCRPIKEAFPALDQHLAASQAAARFRDMHYDLVRIGGLLYGINHIEDTLDVRPIMSFKTVVAQVRQLPAGWFIGYGMQRQLERSTRIALLPLGWTDIFNSNQVGKECVLIGGQACRLLGLCTDFSMVEISHVPNVSVGDEVVVIGGQGTRIINAIDQGKTGGISTGQLLGKVSLRVPRVYSLHGHAYEELSLLS